ncbi:MAG: radical SAM protein [Oscillospiraceae bacterium]|jgi:putative pyruvate formate lyase activating enzyme|nr:radical SAM protein [Oscillospiraceae bacterium]
MNQICSGCPRECGAARDGETGRGVCASGTLPRIARAGLHRWEEPCVSGTRGSGTVFFSGCALRCVYCQNAEISLGGFGKTVAVQRLREIYAELAAVGAHNINLVNPTHYADAVLASLDAPSGLNIPIIWNSGGYERIGTLRRLAGRIQIYMPDMKYASPELAARYSRAPDYPETAQAAIREMFRQTGPYRLDADGLLTRGVLLRHLVLPGNFDNTKRVIDWVATTFRPGDILFSLMSQYTPCGDLREYPELRNTLTPAEHDAAVAYLLASGVEDGFFQDPPDGEARYIPAFDLSGV